MLAPMHLDKPSECKEEYNHINVTYALLIERREDIAHAYGQKCNRVVAQVGR